MSNAFWITCLTFVTAVALSAVLLFFVPIQTQGYVFGGLAFLFALTDSFHSTLLSRTNTLSGLTAFPVDRYQTLCDNIRDFQGRLLCAWIVGKLVQLLLGMVAIMATHVQALTLAHKDWIPWAGTFLLVAQAVLLARMINTYLAREKEIFDIYKEARVLENKRHIHEIQEHYIAATGKA